MGAMEQAKGAIKEAAGNVTGDENLQSEGQAQQDKGRAESKETAHKLAAQADEKQAEQLEREADHT